MRVQGNNVLHEGVVWVVVEAGDGVVHLVDAFALSGEPRGICVVVDDPALMLELQAIQVSAP